jgi:hypothetical protein
MTQQMTRNSQGETAELEMRYGTMQPLSAELSGLRKQRIGMGSIANEMAVPFNGCHRFRYSMGSTHLGRISRGREGKGR